MNYHNNSQTIPYAPLPIPYQPPAQVIRRPPPLIRSSLKQAVPLQNVTKIEKPLPVFSKGHPWDQQEGEPDAWFVRFKRFISMPREKRTIIEFYRIETDKKGSSLPGTWSLNTQKFKWLDRANAYDLHREEKHLAKIESAQDRFRGAYENAMANFAETFLKASTVKSREELEGELKVRIGILKDFAQREISILTSVYKGIFGEKHTVDSSVKREMVVIFEDEPIEGYNTLPPMEVTLERGTDSFNGLQHKTTGEMKSPKGSRFSNRSDRL